MSQPPKTQPPGTYHAPAPKATTPHRCDCGKRFASNSALCSHRKDSPAHKNTDSPTNSKTNDGRNSKDASSGKGSSQAPAEGNKVAEGLTSGPAQGLGTVKGGLQRYGDTGSGSDVRCSCGRTFKHANDMQRHQRDSPMHKPDKGATHSHAASRPLAASRSTEADSSRSTRENNLTSSDIADAQRRTQPSSETINKQAKSTAAKHQTATPPTCTCGKSFKHAAALAAHQRDSPKHNKSAPPGQAGPSSSTWKKQSKRAKGQRGYGSGGGRGDEYDYSDQDSDVGYQYSYGYGFGGIGDGYDWGLCDKDCGWCGHCMDNVDI